MYRPRDQMKINIKESLIFPCLDVNVLKPYYVFNCVDYPIEASFQLLVYFSSISLFKNLLHVKSRNFKQTTNTTEKLINNRKKNYNDELFSSIN